MSHRKSRLWFSVWPTFITVYISSIVTNAAPSGSIRSGQARPSFFRVSQQDGVWWLITPDGKPFFSLGVDVVDRGLERQKYDPKRPGYASFRYYKDDAAWSKSVLSRLREWGFNTLGGWSDVDVLKKSQEPMLPYTVGLWMGSMAGVPWFDIFGPRAESIFDKAAREICLPRKDDPLLIGYYTDNELGWWDETCIHYYLKQKPNPTRKRLVDLLKQHYGGSFARLRKDFITIRAGSFAQLERKGELRLKPGSRGRIVIDKFIFEYARRYYQLARDSIRRYDKNHLILGDRYIQWQPDAVARAIGPYVDVVSTNYNADWTDGENNRFYFDRLHRLTGKPIMITEYYICADENRSGNRNSGKSFATVKSQKQRASGFRTNLTSYIRLPYVVGAHWFQYYDEPKFGRSDGEDFNMGLVDINDRPYEELTTAATEIGRESEAMHRAAGTRASILAAGVVELPPAPARPEAGLLVWPKSRAVVPSSQTIPVADLYACWTPERLILATHYFDWADKKLHAHGKVAPQDRADWAIQLDDKSAIRARIGHGGEAQSNATEAKCLQWIANLRITGMISIPARRLGRVTLREGDLIRLRSTLVTHDRGQRMTWDRTLKLGR